ncbi:hypothetical protein B5F40_03850 [Gordonibacter sp. An230]|nr:hypothetical protein B5F40_03850 [Gordonibacter sp. An230]
MFERNASKERRFCGDLEVVSDQGATGFVFERLQAGRGRMAPGAQCGRIVIAMRPSSSCGWHRWRLVLVFAIDRMQAPRYNKQLRIDADVGR